MKYIKYTSHRLRDRLSQITGKEDLPTYYNLNKSYQLIEIEDCYLKEVLQLKGAKQGQLTKDWSLCWK